MPGGLSGQGLMPKGNYTVVTSSEAWSCLEQAQLIRSAQTCTGQAKAELDDATVHVYPTPYAHALATVLFRADGVDVAPEMERN